MTDLYNIATGEVRPMPRVFTAAPSSTRILHVIDSLRQTEPHLAGRLADRMAVKLAADILTEVVGDVLLLEQTQSDLLEDIKIKREIIRRLGGGQ